MENPQTVNHRVKPSAFEWIAALGIIVIVAIAAATYLGVRVAPQVQVENAAPTPRVSLPRVQEAQPPIVQPTPIRFIIGVEDTQAVPRVEVPQAPQPVQEAAPPAPKPQVIVIRENAGKITVTGSGACAVGGSVARRCARP